MKEINKIQCSKKYTCAFRVEKGFVYMGYSTYENMVKYFIKEQECSYEVIKDDKPPRLYFDIDSGLNITLDKLEELNDVLVFKRAWDNTFEYDKTVYSLNQSFSMAYSVKDNVMLNELNNDIIAPEEYLIYNYNKTNLPEIHPDEKYENVLIKIKDQQLKLDDVSVVYRKDTIIDNLIINIPEWFYKRCNGGYYTLERNIEYYDELYNTDYSLNFDIKSYCDDELMSLINPDNLKYNLHAQGRLTLENGYWCDLKTGMTSTGNNIYFNESYSDNDGDTMDNISKKIRDLVQENDTSLLIGVKAKWGTGKSHMVVKPIIDDLYKKNDPRYARPSIIFITENNALNLKLTAEYIDLYGEHFESHMNLKTKSFESGHTDADLTSERFNIIKAIKLPDTCRSFVTENI
eukprot:Awhi_evm6s12155